MENPIVIDNGSGTIKAGFAESGAPAAVVPSLVGTGLHQGGLVALGQDSYVGAQVEGRRDRLVLTSPIQHGHIVDWDAMTKLWEHTFYEQLRTAPEESPILMTEVPFNTDESRAQAAQILFDRFGVPAIHMISAPLLALLASGRQSGVVVSVGEGATNIVPIFEGDVLQHASIRHDFAGQDLTRGLAKELAATNSLFATNEGYVLAQQIKEQHGYIAMDAEREAQAAEAVSVALPDGSSITVSSERVRFTEPLFQPSLLGVDADGLHQIVYNAIMKCDLQLRPGLCSNIVLTGGSTLFAGMEERLLKELSALLPPTMGITVYAPPERLNTAWIGGALLAQSDAFQDKWITPEAFEADGAALFRLSRLS